jgi:hypothetical protein
MTRSLTREEYLGNAELILRSTLVDTELILRSTILHSRGSGQRGGTILTSLGSEQRQPWPRKLSSPQTGEGHHDTSECED